MTIAFHRVYTTPSERRTNIKTGAYVLALQEVVKAMELRGIYP